MNKWYQSAPCKGILLVLEHVLAAVMMTCLIWTLAYPGGDLRSALMEKPQEKYEDSGGFEEQLLREAGEVIWAAPQTDKYETDGKFDENKIVDIKAYSDSREISGENRSGFAYHMKDLTNWSDNELVYGQQYDTGLKDIVVCQKDDGSYRYYYAEDFRKAVQKGELQFGNLALAKENYDLEENVEIVDALTEGWIESGNSIFREILDKDRQPVYAKCWMYTGARVEEEYPPIGYEDILELVNTDPKWNGKLNDAMEQLSNTMIEMNAELRSWGDTMNEWQEGNTNAAYLLVDLAKNRVYTNRLAYQKADDWQKNIAAMKKLGKYVVVTPKLAGFESNMDASASEWRMVLGGNSWTEDYVFAFAVDTEYPIQDMFYQESRGYVQYAPMLRGIFILGVAAAFAILVILVWLTIVSGHSNKEEGIRLSVIDHMKTELFLMISGGAFCGAVTIGVMACAQVFNGNYHTYTTSTSYSSTGYSVAENMISLGMEEMIMIGAAAVLICAAGLVLWLGMVRRLKAHTIWKNSILRVLAQVARLAARHMNIIWKTALVFGGFVLIHWIAVIFYYQREWTFIMLLAEGAAFFCLVHSAIGKNRIKKGVQAIASGQVDYQIPLGSLRGEQREVAEAVNKIGDGLDKAVEESMKNERLKTDLITNVSHDIKTPLTSIINYVEILKREKFENPKIQEYLKVLEEKSYRLKTLTEDVVEASKVSSGNVSLEMMNLNLVELINQTCAEFEEKFADRNLKLVLNLPGEPVNIYADGRRMWRVLANVFNNAAKYALEGTRVYADLYQMEKEVQFTLKNVSAQALNITADELTERFIRGDVSRSTEGSGLGLSIAQNLTKLQGGTFELYLDGDLFKVLIRFPRYKNESGESGAEAEE